MPSKFSFIHISDHHLRETDALLSRGFSTGYAFRRVLDHIAEHHAHGADFIVTTGDLVESGADAEYSAAKARLQLELQAREPPGPHWVTTAGLLLPMYFLPGNHDPRPAFFRNLFPSARARPQINAAFEHKGVQFVCVDWGDQNQAVAYPEMLDFLARTLQPGQLSIILSHHAVTAVGVAWLDAFLANDLEKFWQVVRGRQVLGIFTGHLHATYERVAQGIPVFGVRATTFQFALQSEKLFCLQPPHYRVVTVDDATLTTQIFEVPL